MIQRSDAFKIMAKHITDELIVAGIGAQTSFLYQYKHRPENLYIRGPMGFAASVGLGVAIARPKRHVIVLEGDGGLMMSISSLAAIAQAKPGNLTLVCLDNGIYESGGKRSTVNAESTDLCQIAKGFGIPVVDRVSSVENLEVFFRDKIKASACTFLRVRIAPVPSPGQPPTLMPFEIKHNFRSALGMG